MGSDEFAVTFAFLGQLLGSDRATVALSTDTLQTYGLIRHRPGHISLIDVAALEGIACECYTTLKTELSGIDQRTLRRSVGAIESTSPG